MNRLGDQNCEAGYNVYGKLGIACWYQPRLEAKFRIYAINRRSQIVHTSVSVY